eukprot:Skav203678  [mRNA]  locus=scaffold259:76795:77088:+ [translate_table: standard]
MADYPSNVQRVLLMRHGHRFAAGADPHLTRRKRAAKRADRDPCKGSRFLGLENCAAFIIHPRKMKILTYSRPGMVQSCAVRSTPKYPLNNHQTNRVK